MVMAKAQESKYKDKLLGLVVHLKVDGEIIKTGSSNPKVLELAEQEEE